jgi:hypothetical protein
MRVVPSGMCHPGAATTTPTELAVPDEAMAYSDEGAAIAGKLRLKLGADAGTGNPLPLDTPVPGPT